VEELKRLKTDRSPGIDELHPKFLHEVRGDWRGISTDLQQVNADWRKVEMYHRNGEMPS